MNIDDGRLETRSGIPPSQNEVVEAFRRWLNAKRLAKALGVPITALVE